MEIDADVARLLEVTRKSERSVFNAYAHVRFFTWLIGGVAFGLVVVTCFVWQIKTDVRRNKDAVKLMWHSLYGNDLPE